METNYILQWRLDESEGIRWFIRGIKPDGSFYGEVSYHNSTAPTRSWSTFVDGQLSPEDLSRCNAIFTEFSNSEFIKPEKIFGALSRWTKTISKPTHLFCYEQGTEAKNLKARRFLELHEIIQKYVSETEE